MPAALYHGKGLKCVLQTCTALVAAAAATAAAAADRGGTQDFWIAAATSPSLSSIAAAAKPAGTAHTPAARRTVAPEAQQGRVGQLLPAGTLPV